MNKSVQISANIINIICGHEFATFTRHPKGDNLFTLVMSIPGTAKIADKLEKSGIIKVQSFTEDGTVTYTRLPFFETHLMIDVVTDLLEYN